MSIQTKTDSSFEQQVSAALTRSAQLAREDTIKHGTSIVVEIDGNKSKTCKGDVVTRLMDRQEIAEHITLPRLLKT